MPFQLIRGSSGAVPCDLRAEWSCADSRCLVHAPGIEKVYTLRGPNDVRSCYRSVLQLAHAFGLDSLAFPLIGASLAGCSAELALQIASEEIGAYLKTHGETYIFLAVRDRTEFRPAPRLWSGLSAYIRAVRERESAPGMAAPAPCPAPMAAPSVSARRESEARPKPQATQKAEKESGLPLFKRKRKAEETAREDYALAAEPVQEEYGAASPMAEQGTYGASAPTEQATYGAAELTLPFAAFLPERGAVLDESFSQMVLRKIDEKGFKKDSDCYTRANIDRRLFSRIRCDEHYHPKKATAVALAVALELSLAETNELLMKAGYSLSHSILFDVIVEYCILRQNYNIFEINELLFAYDQPLLGG